MTEHILDLPQPHYRPKLIGGPLAYIIGYSSRKPPTEAPLTEGPRTEGRPTEENADSNAPIQFPVNVFNNNKRLKKSQQGSRSIIGSFVDMLFH